MQDAPRRRRLTPLALIGVVLALGLLAWARLFGNPFEAEEHPDPPIGGIAQPVPGRGCGSNPRTVGAPARRRYTARDAGTAGVCGLARIHDSGLCYEGAQWY